MVQVRQQAFLFDIQIDGSEGSPLGFVKVRLALAGKERLLAKTSKLCLYLSSLEKKL
jgi:hypothetical protein